MDNIIKIVKILVEREAARIIAYSGTLATAAALFVASKLGVEFSQEFVVGVAGFATIVMTEVIRQLVYSQYTINKADIQGEVGDPP